VSAPADAEVDAALRRMYRAFNDRDVDALLAVLAPDVRWPNAWEGGVVHGRDAVRAYWQRQWAEIDPTVDPERVERRADGTSAVRVRQVVRARDGALLSEGVVTHVYRFGADGLVASMDVEPAD
jgi:ketosteroid isomerase-like protein